MKNKDKSNISPSQEKSSQEKKNEFVNVFKYFENANIRNRDAFCELLDYTVENKEDLHK